MKKDLLRTAEAQELLSVSRSTMERWEREGKIVPVRNGRTKYFKVEDLEKLVGTKLRQSARQRVAYIRVSTQSQKADLNNQQMAIETFAVATGRAIDMWLSDIGSGLNFKRKNFLRLIDMIENDEVEELIVTYKDRLTRFAFELIEERCRIKQTKLTVINLPSSSPQEELVNDLMDVIHVFSSRLYGLRKYKIKKEDLYDSSEDTNLSEQDSASSSC